MAEPTEDDLPTEWEHTVKLAREGNTEAARDILREFAEAVELSSERAWSVPVPWPCAQYLAEAFRQILEHEDTDASRALGLKARKAGRPRGAKTHDEVKLAAAFWLLKRRGRKPEQANELIRKAVGADRTTVQRAANNCSAFEDLDDDLLVAIAAEDPKLQKILLPV